MRYSMTEARRRKLWRQDESVRCWQGAVVLDGRSSSPYGERDLDGPAHHMASRTGTSQLTIWWVGRWCSSSPYVERDEVKIKLWLSLGDLYGRGMMAILLPVSLLVSQKLSFNNFLWNSFSGLYEALNIDFRILFWEEIFFGKKYFLGTFGRWFRRDRFWPQQGSLPVVGCQASPLTSDKTHSSSWAFHRHETLCRVAFGKLKIQTDF